MYREQGRATLPEASRYGDIKHMELVLRLQKVFFYEEGNLHGNSHLIIHGNESHQQDIGGKKSFASEQRKSWKMWLLTWLGPKPCFRLCVLSSVTKETSKPIASGLDHGQGCRDPRWVADKLWKCLGRTEVPPLFSGFAEAGRHNTIGPYRQKSHFWKMTRECVYTHACSSTRCACYIEHM